MVHLVAIPKLLSVTLYCVHGVVRSSQKPFTISIWVSLVLWNLGWCILHVESDRVLSFQLICCFGWVLCSGQVLHARHRRDKLTCFSGISHAHFTLACSLVFLSYLAQFKPSSCIRIERPELLKQVLTIVHATSYKYVIIAEWHGKVLSTNNGGLIVTLTLDSVPAHGFRVKLLHVRWAHLYSRIDPLKWDHAWEEIQIEVLSLGLTLVDWSRAHSLNDWTFIFNSWPRVKKRIDLVNLE